MIYKEIQQFKKSEIPADRLFYLKAMKQWIEIGKRLNKIRPNQETTETLETLREEIKDYKIYPKLD